MLLKWFRQNAIEPTALEEGYLAGCSEANINLSDPA
jgi:hypothetical protein